MAFNHKKWLIFYTDSPNSDDESGYWVVNILYINIIEKKYILSLDSDERNTDGEYEDGTQVNAKYTDLKIFEQLLNAVREQNYKEITFTEL